jgi:[acyl-carrier-protein] S-malonyltransferase
VPLRVACDTPAHGPATKEGKTLNGIAFLYPGQGSQKVGMGAELREADPDLYERYLALAEEASGLPIRRLSLEGPIEELTRTDTAQPALFALSLAITESGRGSGLRPEFVAGHSLGEYTAAVVSGALSTEDGMRLVSLRGRLMADAQSERPGAMAAVIGLPSQQLAELCEQASEAASASVTLANLNSPTQIVVSGEEAAVDGLMLLAQEAGATKVVRLQVGAAFHSELMKPVQARMAEAMVDIAWSKPEVPLVSNASGTVVETGEEIHQALVAQIASPVRWVDCVQTLVDRGCTTFVELGPGRVLSGLVRQISAGVDSTPVDSPRAVEEFVQQRSSLSRP